MQGNKEELGRKQIKKQRQGVLGSLGEQTQVQFQKMWKEAMVGFQNQENIRQLRLDTQISARTKQNELKLWSNPFVLLVLLLVILAIEISVEVSVLLIQYICSNIGLNTFCALLTLAIFLLILVILSLLKLNSKGLLRGIKITPSSLTEPSPMQSNPPTILKIQKPHPSKCNQKTKKLKEPYDIGAVPKSHRQTIKKIIGQQLSGNKCNLERSLACPQECSQSKIFLSIKLVQNVSIFVLGCICLSTVQNPKTEGLSYVGALVVLEFVLIIVSSLLAHQIYYITAQSSPQQMLAPCLKSQIIQAKIYNFIKEEIKQPSKPQTALSIEQHLRSQSSVPQMPPTSGEKIKSRINFNPKDQEFSPEIVFSPAQELKLLELSKKKRNKSVLKASKSNKSRGDPGKEDESSEDEEEDGKKKVQINFKKIQYFEYDRSSPANSVLCESEASQKKSRIRSKYSMARQQRYSEIHEAENVNKQLRKEAKRRTKSVSEFQQPQTVKNTPNSTRSKFRTQNS